ncbi:hypothetical protein RB213_011061, partial [Colletotrichum asianum]
ASPSSALPEAQPDPPSAGERGNLKPSAVPDRLVPESSSQNTRFALPKPSLSLGVGYFRLALQISNVLLDE